MINLVERPSIGGPDDIPAADWRDTLSTRASFVLRSPHPLDGDEELVQQSSLGHHLFAIQAIDDHGDSSNIDWLSITSRNVLPRTTIEYPTLPVEAGLVQFREAVEIRWTGFDPDSPDPDRMPAAYEWKVIPLPQNIPAFTVDVHYAITTTPGPQYEWNRLDGSVNSLRLNLQSGIDYVFALRAIDVVDGTEDIFVRGRNALPFTVSSVS